MHNFENIKIHYITHKSDKYKPHELAEAACKAGIKCIQLRMKNSGDEDIIAEGHKIREICNKYNAIFILNDKLELADIVKADGVHLGKEDMNIRQAREIAGKKMIIGATANTFQDILNAYNNSADYIGLGPFRETFTKEKLSPVLGADGLKNIIDKCNKNNIKIPVYAIGGIKKENIRDLSETGISGVALSSAITDAGNPIEEGIDIMKELDIYFNKQ